MSKLRMGNDISKYFTDWEMPQFFQRSYLSELNNKLTMHFQKWVYTLTEPVPAFSTEAATVTTFSGVYAGVLYRVALNQSAGKQKHDGARAKGH